MEALLIIVGFIVLVLFLKSRQEKGEEKDVGSSALFPSPQLPANNPDYTHDGGGSAMAPQLLSLAQQKVYRFFPKGPTVTARERAFLPEDQQRRWDYFYRPDPNLVFQIKLNELLKAEEDVIVRQKTLDDLKKKLAERQGAMASAEQKRKLGWLLTGLVWIGFLVILLLVSISVQGTKSGDAITAVGMLGGLVALFASGIIYLTKGQELDTLRNEVRQKETEIQEAETSLKMSQNRLDDVKEVRNDLMSQVTKSPPPPTDDEMLEFWNEHLDLLAKKAMEECNISPNELLDRNHRIQFNEWGRLQEKSRPGYTTLDNFEERHEAFVITRSGSLLYCSNYVEFIFLTEKNIDIYGTFFDMISGLNYGERVATFYYQHVTNVRTEVDLVDLDFLGIERQEAMSIILRVSSGDYVRVTLTDENIQQQIGDWANEDVKEIDLKLKNLRAELERTEDETQKEGIKKRIARLEAKRGPTTIESEIATLREKLEKSTDDAEKEGLTKEIAALEARRAPVGREKLTIETKNTRGKARVAIRAIRTRILEMQKAGRGQAGTMDSI